MNIKRVIARLEEIIAYSEKEFLSVGKSLHHIDEQVVRICEEAKVLNASMKHTVFEKQIEFFDSLSIEHSAMIPSTQVIASLLKRIGTLLIDDQNQLRKMIHHIKGMQKTDMVVRVELAHLDSDAATFANLAGEVKTLASEIKNRSDSLLTTSLKMSVHIESTVSQVNELFKSISDKFTRLKDASIKRLSEMHQHHKESKTLSSTLSKTGAQLRDHLDIMVRKLQMHDIIRQQLQQVITLLENHSAKDVPITLLEQSISSLNRSNDDFFTAIEHIRMQLISVNGQLTGLLGQCTHLTTLHQISAEPGDENSIHRNRHMDELVSTISHCAKVEGILNTLITDISSDLSQNRLSLEEIKILGTDIELSAQNAAVTAENAHENDATLSVMAEQTQREINSIQGLLSQIIVTQQQIEVQAQDLIAIFREINRDIETLVEIMAEFDERLMPLETFQEQTTQRISILSEHLEQVLTSISPLVDTFHNDSSNSSAILEAIQLLEGIVADCNSQHDPEDEALLSKGNTYQKRIETAVQQQLLHPPPKESKSSKIGLNDDLGEDIEIF